MAGSGGLWLPSCWGGCGGWVRLFVLSEDGGQVVYLRRAPRPGGHLPPVIRISVGGLLT